MIAYIFLILFWYIYVSLICLLRFRSGLLLINRLFFIMVYFAKIVKILFELYDVCSLVLIWLNC